MALVSDNLKLIFIHIFKNAGMSIRYKLAEIDPDAYSIIKGHADISEVKGYFEEIDDIGKFYGYKKFAVVRNPYDWLISIYNFAKNQETHPFNSIAIKKDINDFVYWFTNYMASINEAFNLNGKIQLQSDYITLNDKIAVDYVLKFENLQNDFQNLLEPMNLDSDYVLDLRNNNEYDRSIEQLNNSTIKFINYNYYKDFKNFNYPFL